MGRATREDTCFQRVFCLRRAYGNWKSFPTAWELMRNRESDFLQTQSLLDGNQNFLPPSGRQWFTSLPGLAGVSLLIWGLLTRILQSDFQRMYEHQGHRWHLMVPIRNGKVVSPYVVPGCMVGEGRFHFADIREDIYFIQAGNRESDQMPAPHHIH